VMRALMADLIHHLKVYRLLDEENMVERATWMLRSERLLWEMEELLPALK